MCVIEGDPGYLPWVLNASKGRVRVFLNGQELTHVRMADEEAGLVEFYAVDELDRTIIIRGGDGQPTPKRITRAGRVEIRVEPRDP